MEFAVCPSCQQSVLDDDAVNCPFCGSPMNAKPGTVKPAAPALSGGPLKAKGGVPAPGKRPATTDLSDIAPVDISDGFGETAIPASLKRTKSRPMPVTCPMCDTVGYVTPEAAGQSVKCANPQCLVPVFTAPKKALAEKAAASAPVKKKRSLVGVALVTLIVMAVGGGLVYWVASRPDTITISGKSQEAEDLIKEFAQQQGAPADKTKSAPVKPTEQSVDGSQENEPAATAPEEVIPRMLAMINEISLIKEGKQNRNKAFCRRLAAEAYVLAGDWKGAQEQLKSLDQVGANVPFYRASPLALRGWMQLAKKDRKGATGSAESALKSAAHLPKTGRDRFEVVISLAALLIAVERTAEADELLKAHSANDPPAQLASALAAVRAMETYDLAAYESNRPALAWQSPLQTGVVAVLAARKQTDAAKQWTASLTNDRDRAEGLAVWAETAVWAAQRQGQELDVGAWQSALESLPPNGAALALSRLGLSLKSAGRTAEAQDCLRRAVEKLGAAEKPEDWSVPVALKALYRFPRVEGAPRQFAAAATGETAHLAAKLGEKEQAADWLLKSLALASSVGPNPAAIQKLKKEADGMSPAALRDYLKKEWKLKSANESNAAANEVHRTIDKLIDDAALRVALQKRLLTEAVAWGLPETVWNYIRRGTTPAEIEAADNLLYSELPGLVEIAFTAQGNADQAALVKAAWAQLVPDRPLEPDVAGRVAQRLQGTQSNRFEEAARLLNPTKKEPVDYDDVALAAVCRLAAEKKYDEAFALTAELQDILLREECGLHIAAMAGLKGGARAVERQLPKVSQVTEKISMARGLIAGTVIRPVSGVADTK